MALKIVYGRGGSGKTAFCFDTIANMLEQDRKIIYLVPEQFSLESERRIASRFSAAATSLVQVLSFERLAHQVFLRFGPLYKEYINDAGRHMLVQRALLAIENKLTVLSQAAKQPDFADEMSAMISEWKRHNVSAKKITDMIEVIENPILKLKLEDLALIYTTYCESMDKSIGDEEDSLSILSERIQRYGLFSDASFIIDQFAGFTPQEYGVIETLLRQGGDMIIALTSDSLEMDSQEGIDVFAQPKETAQRLFRLAMDNHIEILPNTFMGDCKKYQNNAQLLHLEQNYFKYPGKIYEKQAENIIIYEANNYYGETEAAAKKVIKLCRDEGLRYRDIVIATRGETVYFPLVRHIFAEYGIPCFINEKKPATKHPLSGLIRSLLDIQIYNWNTVHVLQYLKLGFSNIKDEDIFLIENYALASGLNHGQWTSDKPLTFVPQGFSEEDVIHINQIRAEIVKPIIAFKNKFSGRKKTREIALALYSFLTDHQIDQGVQNRIDDFACKDMLEDARAWKLAWDMLINTLDQMVEILGEESITFARFSSVFESGLSSYNLAQIPPMADQVQVCALEGFQSHGSKVMMVLGTTEGILPKGYMQEGLLSDADRKILREKGLELAQDTIAKQMAEQYLIYQCITAPTYKQFFFYPLADNEGKALNPSPIIGRLCKLFPNLSRENNIYVNEGEAEIEGAKQLFWQTVERLAKKEPMSTKWQTLLAWYQENWQDMLQYADNALAYTNLPKRLSQASKELLYGQAPYTSISRIEGYARCQFAHFVQYGLAITPRKEYQLKAVDVGSLMHGIIEQFSLHMQQHEGGWKAVNKADADVLVAQICDNMLQEYLGDAQLGSARLHQLSLKLKRIMSVTIWSIAQFYKNTSFEPLGYEIAFGTDGELPPLEIELENGKKVRLVGKVDRVDVCRTASGNHISVVDYKSSSKDMDYAFIMAGLQVQLPVYLDAICRALAKKEGAVFIKTAMLYYAIDAPFIDAPLDASEQEIWQATEKELKMRGIILSDEEKGQELTVMVAPNSAIQAEKIDQLCSFTLKKLQRVMEEMLSGSIKINPYRSDNVTACKYCPYASVCRFDTDFTGNKYHLVRRLKKEEFFEYAGKMD